MKTIFWLPRILGILLCVFISLFALDAFDGNSPLGRQILGFLIHLIPTYLLVFALILAWKKQVIGGIIFILLGFAYLLFAHNQHWSAYLIIAGIPMLIGFLFVIEYFQKSRNLLI